MGVLTRLQIRDQLRVALGGRTDRPDPELDLYITLGYTLVCQPEVRRHEELKARYDVSLVADTAEYDISKATVGFNILGLRLVEFLDSTAPAVDSPRYKLRPRPEEFFSRAGSGGTSGPRFYLRDGNTLVLSPYPSTGAAGKFVRLHVWREPVPLTNDTDTTVLLDYFDNAVILAAQYHAQMRLGYRELAINTLQQLQSYVNQKLDAGETDSDTGSRIEVITGV